MPPKPQPKPKPTDLIDVVVHCRGNSLAFLQSWKKFLGDAHIIVVTDADTSPTAPEGFSAVEVFSRKDIQAALGDKAWAISARDFGLLVSKKQYVYLLDETAQVATAPVGGEINPLLQHLTNLSTPATPFFFNTLYDPYVEGTDFVRGYPFSLREGAPTALSHGLWLGSPDYDAATLKVKGEEQNTRYVNMVMTIPKGAMFCASGKNLAINRSLAGVAMYHGLAPAGTPAGAAGDTWAGWCAKVISDHLGYGCKSGIPYVTCARSGAAVADAPEAVQQQEELAKFFQTVQLSESSSSAEAAYAELASLVRQKLGSSSASYGKLADAMEAWIACWKQYSSA